VHNEEAFFAFVQLMEVAEGFLHVLILIDIHTLYQRLPREYATDQGVDDLLMVQVAAIGQENQVVVLFKEISIDREQGSIINRDTRYEMYDHINKIYKI